MDIHRLFKRGETWTLCREAMRAKGAMTTKEPALELMKARNLETGDKVLARALGQKFVHSLRMQHQRGKLLIEGKRKGAMIRRLPEEQSIFGEM